MSGVVSRVVSRAALLGHRHWARRTRNLFGRRDVDQLDPPAGDLRGRFLEHLRSEGVDPAGWRITLVTNLRIMGYVFNPASFYLCRDAAGVLRVVVVEVHNTHLERHLYTLRPRSEGPHFVSSMEKDFYVSPFIDMVGQYTVHVQDDPTRLRIAINERRRPLLATSPSRATALTNRPSVDAVPPSPRRTMA
jgi:DUF1365 family protein